jgi:hypothetical protein
MHYRLATDYLFIQYIKRDYSSIPHINYYVWTTDHNRRTLLKLGTASNLRQDGAALQHVIHDQG